MAPTIDTSLPSTAAGKTVFLTGATGYIGGAVLTKLLSLSSSPSAITALIRDPKKAELLSSIPTPSGTTLTPLLGSLDDHDKLKKAAETHDIVISTADADDLGSIQALIAGMKERRKKTGHRSLFIHTSGTGVLADNAKGQYPNDIVGDPHRKDVQLMLTTDLHRSQPHSSNEEDSRAPLAGDIAGGCYPPQRRFGDHQGRCGRCIEIIHHPPVHHLGRRQR